MPEEHLARFILDVVEQLDLSPLYAYYEREQRGYLSESNVARASCRGIDMYIAPGRLKHGKDGAAATEGNDNSVKARMKVKLATDEGQAIYSRRKVIVEPVFGQIKNRGFRQFLLRGLDKVFGAFSLMGISHNLLKLHRAALST